MKRARVVAAVSLGLVILCATVIYFALTAARNNLTALERFEPLHDQAIQQNEKLNTLDKMINTELEVVDFYRLLPIPGASDLRSRGKQLEEAERLSGLAREQNTATLECLLSALEDDRPPKNRDQYFQLADQLLKSAGKMIQEVETAIQKPKPPNK